MVNTHELLQKYKHQLILKNLSKNTIQSYVSCLHLFFRYIGDHNIKEMDGKRLLAYFTQDVNFNLVISIQL